MKHLRMAIGVGVLLTGGCELADIGTEVKYVGPSQTARPSDCRMQMIFGPLPYAHQDIARARTDCPDHLDDEELCIDSIRRKACLVGADTVYGVAETREGEVSYLNATFARLLPGPVDGPPSIAPARLACDPMCSPGFACEKGTCVPRCNPACAADEICTPQRLCAPTHHRMSKAPQREVQREVATVISWDHAWARHETANDVAADVAGKAGTPANVASDVQLDRLGIDLPPSAPKRGHE